MSKKNLELTVPERVKAVLNGKVPDRLPFIDRLELWHRHHQKAGDLPERFEGLDLNGIHSNLAMGRQKFTMPLSLKLNHVDLNVTHNSDILLRDTNPVYQEFPALNAPWFVPRDKVGDTIIEFSTPCGKLRIKYTMTESMAAGQSVEPYLTEHLIKKDSDYAVAEYILEHSEIVTQFEKITIDEAEVGNSGFVVPRVHRIPFQQALLEYLGEISLFTALYENRNRLDRLIHILDLQLTEMIKLYADVDVIMVQFPDNLDGVMTNPNLFKEYCLPHYQKYADMFHGQKKKICSHTDGELKPLLELLPESGLDVYESFSPWPLTELRFEEAWAHWSKSAIIWGGIPSPFLDSTMEEEAFRNYVDRFFEMVSGHPIIIGIGDQVMPGNIIDRIEYIAKRVENK